MSTVLFNRRPLFFLPLFFFNDTATTEIYTLSLHDALPISKSRSAARVFSWPPCVHGPIIVRARGSFSPRRSLISRLKFAVAPSGPYASSYQPERFNTAACTRPYVLRSSAQSHHGSAGGGASHS